MKVGRIEQLTHTPGPWTSRGNSVYGSGAKVAEVPSRLTTPGATMPPEDVTANARLIAAAPDLLAVCRRFLEMYDNVRDSVGPSVKAAIEHAERAIAKAEGK